MRLVYPQRRLRVAVSFVVSFAAAAVASVLSGCQTVDVKPLPNDADPSAEISRLETDSDALVTDQAHVLSPTHYQAAKRALKEAKELRNTNSGNEQILARVAEGNAHVAKAHETVRLAGTAMPQLIQARRAAINANAPKVLAEDMRAADRDLQAQGSRLESGDLPANSDRDELTKIYGRIEVDALKKDKLGVAHDDIIKAKKEGAETAAKRSLADAIAAYTDAENFIAAHPKDAEGISAASAKASGAAQHALTVTRDVRAVGGKDTESLVLDRERHDAERAQQAAELTAKDLDAAKQASELAAKNVQIAVLSDAEAFNDRFKAAQAKFTPSEGEVYRQGDTLVLRLRGLQFKNGKTTIDPTNYALLGKVKEVIASFGAAAVTVEGHTDSSGKANKNLELSEQRADAVRAYLQANGVGSNVRMTSQGMGDTKPLVPNTTAANRAQNRRVDISIAPARAPTVSH